MAKEGAKDALTAYRLAQFLDEVYPKEELGDFMDTLAQEFVAEGRTSYETLARQWRTRGYAHIAAAFDVAMKKAVKRVTH